MCEKKIPIFFMPDNPKFCMKFFYFFNFFINGIVPLKSLYVVFFNFVIFIQLKTYNDITK